MELLASLETMAENAAASPTSTLLSNLSSTNTSESTFTSNDSSSDPHHGQVERWARLFPLTTVEAETEIKAHYSDLTRLRISNQHWAFVREDIEPQGHDKESYPYYLMKHNSRTTCSQRRKPATKSPEFRYIFKLVTPLDTLEKIASVIQSPASALKLHTDQDDSSQQYVEIDGNAKSLIEAYIESSGLCTRPIFASVRAHAPKDLCSHSLSPQLGPHDTTVPHFRLDKATCTPRPTQDGYPVPYFFYGTLGAPEKLSSLLNLDVQPILHPAVVKGGKIMTWGKYRALVDGDEGDEVVGWMYEVQNREHEDALRFYEGSAYEVVRCDVEMVGGGGMVVRGLTFRFRGA
ncbi:hypothetical protein K491DRAFT_672115 [Lophiostoma macrostomum CBS 122681]|uniref:Putative gamma-glutamylcyclotransferase n=1 Tax=Lophiostoma macrostomum CBS 122681 TaxID=1314788 RepID=A0A6A6SIM2_9PLEO|nr:hypothetical protein K491DRAFT_672115 [Lophiostoma macrostomum CBS 122681]